MDNYEIKLYSSLKTFAALLFKIQYALSGEALLK